MLKQWQKRSLKRLRYHFRRYRQPHDVDLRNKGISGKEAENALVKAEITVNKNMVPFDDKSPFVTSGIRVGTPAITTRGLVEEDMDAIVDLIDRVMDHTNEEVIEQVANEVNEMMSERAILFSKIK
jgi:glycine hydroxymethyltransferase